MLLIQLCLVGGLSIASWLFAFHADFLCFPDALSGLQLSSSGVDSTCKSEAMFLRVDCPLCYGDTLWPQVEEFKYFGILFTNWGRVEWEIGAMFAVKVKPSIYQLVYIPTPTYGHKL